MCISRQTSKSLKYHATLVSSLLQLGHLGVWSHAACVSAPVTAYSMPHVYQYMYSNVHASYTLHPHPIGPLHHLALTWLHAVQISPASHSFTFVPVGNNAVSCPCVILVRVCSTESIEERVFECPQSEDVMGFINMCKKHFQSAAAPRSKEEQQQWQKVRNLGGAKLHQ